MLFLVLICSALVFGLLLVSGRHLNGDRRARDMLASRLAAQQRITQQTQLTLQAMRQAVRQTR